jgi:hypothetical protein
VRETLRHPASKLLPELLSPPIWETGVDCNGTNPVICLIFLLVLVWVCLLVSDLESFERLVDLEVVPEVEVEETGPEEAAVAASSPVFLNCAQDPILASERTLLIARSATEFLPPAALGEGGEAGIGTMVGPRRIPESRELKRVRVSGVVGAVVVVVGIRVGAGAVGEKEEMSEGD